MQIQPVLLLGPDGEAVAPLQSSDLAPLATESTLATLSTDLAALRLEVQALPKRNTKAHQVTLSLGDAVSNLPVALGLLSKVHAVTIKNLIGSATVKLGSVAESEITLAQGEVRDGLEVDSLLISSVGGAGWSLTLEIHGR